VLVQSSSAAGKTTLMDAVLALMPGESRKRASAISEMALYYDQDGLQHKILAIAEEEGAQSASYSLKLLQSDGSLTFARPVKNPDTGELVTRTHQVDGPVQLMLTTTKTLLDDELANRCLVLTVSEDAEQTESIHERQREAFDFGGVKARVQREQLRAVHQNAQRLLQPLQVINPFSKQLRFTAARVRARRDHQKYVDLIASVTLLHQFQRDRVWLDENGDIVAAGSADAVMEAVLSSPEDIAIANEIAHVLLGQSLDELSAPGRKFLLRLDAYVTQVAAAEGRKRHEVALTCRAMAQALGLAQSSVRRVVAELVENEWLTVQRAQMNQPATYFVHFNAEEPQRDRVCLNLVDPSSLIGEDGEICTLDASLLTELASLLTGCSPVAHWLLTGCSPVAHQKEMTKSQLICWLNARGWRLALRRRIGCQSKRASYHRYRRRLVSKWPPRKPLFGTMPRRAGRAA
jgi:hypothetical protein